MLEIIVGVGYAESLSFMPCDQQVDYITPFLCFSSAPPSSHNGDILRTADFCGILPVFINSAILYSQKIPKLRYCIFTMSNV